MKLSEGLNPDLDMPADDGADTAPFDTQELSAEMDSLKLEVLSGFEDIANAGPPGTPEEYSVFLKRGKEVTAFLGLMATNNPGEAQAFIEGDLAEAVAKATSDVDSKGRPNVEAGLQTVGAIVNAVRQSDRVRSQADQTEQNQHQADQAPPRPNGEPQPLPSSVTKKELRQQQVNAERKAAEVAAYKPRNAKERLVFKAMAKDPALVTKLLHLKRVSRPDLIDGKNTDSLTRIKQKAIQAHIRAQEAGGKKYEYGDTKHTRALFEGIDLSENTLRLMNEANQVRIRHAEQVAAKRHRERIYGVNHEAEEIVKNRLQTDEKFTVNLTLARERYAEELKRSKHPDKVNRNALRKRVAKHYVAGESPINEYDKDLERALIAGFKLRKHEVQSLIESAVEDRNNKAALENSRGNFAELEAEGTGGNSSDKEAWNREYKSARNRLLAGLNKEEKERFLAEEKRKLKHSVLMWTEVNLARLRAIGAKEDSSQYQHAAAMYELAVDQYLETDPDLDPTNSSYADYSKAWKKVINTESRNLRHTEKAIREKLLAIFMEHALSNEFDADETHEITLGKHVLTYNKADASNWYAKLLKLHTADMSEAERESFLQEQDGKAAAISRPNKAG